jgi:hypothetical protein
VSFNSPKTISDVVDELERIQQELFCFRPLAERVNVAFAEQLPKWNFQVRSTEWKGQLYTNQT